VMKIEAAQKLVNGGGRLWIQMTERPEQVHLDENRIAAERQTEMFASEQVFRVDGIDTAGIAGKQYYRQPDFDRSEIQSTE